MVVLVLPAEVRRNLMGAPSLALMHGASLRETQQKRTNHR
jgi:hypothetical protein